MVTPVRDRYNKKEAYNFRLFRLLEIAVKQTAAPFV
jgi:hypothetical protein